MTNSLASETAAGIPLQHLFVPTRETRNIDLLSKVCFWSGIQVNRLGPGQESQLPEGCTPANSAVHGGTSFCRQLAAAMGAAVLEPADDFLARLPPEYANRRIELMRLDEARSLERVSFIKPVNDKYFPAGLYAAGADLPVGIAFDQRLVLVSEPVEWDGEFRMFVRDRQIRASSPYRLESGNLVADEQQGEARQFCERVLSDDRIELPRAVVMDVGFIKEVGWAVVELNTAVMSSLYDCDPVAVLKVLPYGLVAL